MHGRKAGGREIGELVHAYIWCQDEITLEWISCTNIILPELSEYVKKHCFT